MGIVPLLGSSEQRQSDRVAENAAEKRCVGAFRKTICTALRKLVFDLSTSTSLWQVPGCCSAYKTSPNPGRACAAKPCYGRQLFTGSSDLVDKAFVGINDLKALVVLSTTSWLCKVFHHSQCAQPASSNPLERWFQGCSLNNTTWRGLTLSQSGRPLVGV